MLDSAQMRLFDDDGSVIVPAQTQPVLRKQRATVADDYWDEPTEENRRKTDLYTTYFMSWQDIMHHVLSARRREDEPLVYLDLYAGRGRYKNGEDATAIRIVQNICQDPYLSQHAQIVLNERDPETFTALSASLDALSGISGLAYKPRLDRKDAAEALKEYLSDYRNMTKLIILDPWGYQLYEPDLWQAVLDGWGTDCLFFLNNRRIRLLLHQRSRSPQSRSTNVDRLFGTQRAEELREACASGLDKVAMDTLIIRTMDDILRERRLHATRFVFMHRNGRTVKHSIWTVSKDRKAIEVMRRVAESKTCYPPGGEPILGYNPSPWIAMFGEGGEPWNQRLAKDLQATFGGQPPIRVGDVILQHHRYTNYTNTAYKQVMIEMERARTLTADKPASERRGGKSGRPTLGDDRTVRFLRSQGM